MSSKLEKMIYGVPWFTWRTCYEMANMGESKNGIDTDDAFEVIEDDANRMGHIRLKPEVMVKLCQD